jgi:hypothetical protein
MTSEFFLRIHLSHAEMVALEKTVDALNESNFEKGWPPDLTIEHVAHAWIRDKLLSAGHLAEDRDGAHIAQALEKLRGAR